MLKGGMKGGMPLPKKGTTQYHAQLEIPYKVLKSNGWLSAIIRAFEPAKRSSPKLLSTVP